MKRLLYFLCPVLLSAGLFYGCAPAANKPYEAPSYAEFTEGLIDDIHAEGWIEEFLHRQRTGMTGVPESMSYPYNTCLWAGNITRNPEEHGEDWWRYEQTAYYTDGLLRLGYLLDDEELISKGESGIEYTFSHKDEDGLLPHSRFSYASMWPMSVFFRAVKAYCEVHGDGDIPQKLTEYYLGFDMKEFQHWRNIISIEGMLWAYARTGNQELLDRAVTAWNAGKFGDLTPEACAADTIPSMHGVTFNEELKLPVLLYVYTGEDRYLDLAKNVVSNMDRDELLPDGVNVSAEYLLGNDNVINSHETCDIADMTWTLGYFLMATGEAEWADRIEKAVFNAAPGAITKDFRSLQYFSSVNQVIATGNSNHNDYFHGTTWMAYRPTHETECCVGNVHRIMPNYVSRMWMRGRNGEVVAALYGPSSVDVVLPDGTPCHITEDTDYPFGSGINFIFEPEKATKFSFSFRIPQWCGNASVKINGKPYRKELAAGSFVTIGRKFRPGDVVTLSLEMDVEVKTVENQGIYVQRGPIVYSYPVPQTMTEDKKVYPRLNGKVPGDDSFKCWNITPAGPWNYAIVSDGLVPEVVEKPLEGYPFDDEGVNVKIRVPVRKIDWTLKENRYTPPLPAPDSVRAVEGSGLEYVELVPYGSTELRVTVFPEL